MGKRFLIIEGPYTTTERNAIVNPLLYMLIFNSTTAQFEFYDGSSWIPVPGSEPGTYTSLATSVLNTPNISGATGALTDQIIVDGMLAMETLLMAYQGADEASANDLDISVTQGNVIEVTGNTQINAIKTNGAQNGTVLTLLFTSTPTVKHNTAGSAGYVSMLLFGGLDMVATAGDRLTLMLSEIGGTQAWREVSRTRATAWSGTYTPTLTNVANLAASTAYQCQWLRVDNIVSVSGKVDVDPTLAATATQLGISLPVTSNLGAQEDCAGTAFASGIAGQGAAILGDAANNRAEMNWISGDITNQPMYFIFQYEVI